MSRGVKSKRPKNVSGNTADSTRQRSDRAKIPPIQDARSLLNEPIPERLQKLVDQMRKVDRNKG